MKNTTRKTYGVSSVYAFGHWAHTVYIFDSSEDAEKWLYTEEYRFAERELMTKTAAIKLAGRAAVKRAAEREV